MNFINFIRTIRHTAAPACSTGLTRFFAALAVCTAALGSGSALAQSANISITKAAPVSVNAGGLLTYTFSVTNAGPDHANGSTFTDLLPGGIFTGVTAACGVLSGGASCPVFTTVNNGSVIGNVPTLPVGGSVTFTVSGNVVSFNPPTTISNTVTVATPAGITDSNTGSNSSTTSTTVMPSPLPDIMVTKTADVPSGDVAPGTEITYTVKYTNTTGINAYGVPLADVLMATNIYPAGSSTSGAGAYATVGYTVSGQTCTPSSTTGMPTTCPLNLNPVNTAVLGGNQFAEQTQWAALRPSNGSSVGRVDIPAGGSYTYTYKVKIGSVNSNNSCGPQSLLIQNRAELGWFNGGPAYSDANNNNQNQDIRHTVQVTPALPSCPVKPVVQVRKTLVSSTKNATTGEVSDVYKITMTNIGATDATLTEIFDYFNVTRTSGAGQAGSISFSGVQTTCVASNNATCPVLRSSPTSGSAYPSAYWNEIFVEMYLAVAPLVVPPTGVITLNSQITYKLKDACGAGGYQKVNKAYAKGDADTVIDGYGVEAGSESIQFPTNTPACVNLTVNKTVTPTQLAPNELITFNVTVSNTVTTILSPATTVLNGTATGVVVQDPLPAGVAPGSVAVSCVVATAPAVCGTPTYNAGNNTVTDPNATIGPGGAVSYIITGKANTTQLLGSYSNKVDIASSSNTYVDLISTNNSSQVNFELQDSTALSITKTDNKTSYTPGGAFSYTIVVKNDGPGYANGAIIKDPAVTGINATNVICTATGAAVAPVAQTVAALQSTTGLKIPVFPPGTAVTCTLTGTYAASLTGAITNTATISPPQNGTDTTPNDNTASDTNYPEPTITKSFSPTTIVAGGVTTLTFTITNPLSAAVQTGMAFVDTLPAGLMIANTTVTNTCIPGGTVAVSATGNTINASGLGVLASPATGTPTSCTISVQVTNKPPVVTAVCPNPAGTATTNGATNVTTSGLINGVTNQCVSIVAPPVLTKAFSPTTIAAGGVSTLTFTVTNPAGAPAVSPVSFTDSLPAGLVIQNPTATFTPASCAGAVVAATGGSSIAASGINVPAGASTCRISIAVTNAPSVTSAACPGSGNTTNGPTNISGLGNVTNGVTNQCVVITPPAAPLPTLIKTLSPTQITDGGIATYTFTFTNPAGAPATNSVVAFDQLPASIIVASPSVVGGSCANAQTATSAIQGDTTILMSGVIVPAGLSSCTVTVQVTNVPGEFTPQKGCAGFTNGPGNIKPDGVELGKADDTCLQVTPKPTLTKAFSPTTIASGAVTQLTFTITTAVARNTSIPPTTGISFTDNLPSSLMLANTSYTSTCSPQGSVSLAAGGSSIAVTGAGIGSPPIGGSTSCTITVNVTNRPGTVNPAPTCDKSPAEFTNGPGNIASTVNIENGVKDSCVTVLPTPIPTVSKAFTPSAIAPNGPSSVIFTFTNTAGNPAQSNLNISDTLGTALSWTSATPTITYNAGCTGPASGTATTATGGTLTISGLGISAGVSSCSVTVSSITSAISNPTKANCNAANTGSHNNASLTLNGAVQVQNACLVVGNPLFVKDFVSATTMGTAPLVTGTTIVSGGTAYIRFTFTNAANSPAVVGTGFTDTLSAALIATGGPVLNTCPSGSVNAVPGLQPITVSGVNLPATTTSAYTCYIAVPVTNKVGMTTPTGADTTSCQANPAVSTAGNAGFINSTANISGVSNITSGVTTTCLTVTPPPNKIDVVKAAGVPTQVSAKVFEVPYTIVVGNVGATSPTVFNVQAQDNLSNVYPAPATVTIKPASYTVATNTGGAVCTPAASYTNAVPYNLLAGTDDLTSGQSCVIKFIAVVDYGTSAVDTTVRLNTTYASGMPANGTPNPGYTLPVGGVPVPPAGSSTTDTSVTSHGTPTTTGTTTPPGGAPNTGPTTPTLPATPGADPVIGTPTPVVFVVPKIDVVKAAGVPTQTGPSSFAVPYTVVVKNTGTIPATNVQVDDNLAATFATGAPVLSISTPAATAAPCTVNPAYNGVANPRLLAGADTLAVGASCTITFTVNVAYPSVAAIPAGVQNNTAIANTYTAPPSTIGGPPTGAPIASDISTTGNPPPPNSPPGTPPTPPTPPVTPSSDIPAPTPVAFVVQKIDVVKAAGVPTQVSAKVFEIPYTIVVGNVGATSPTVFNVQTQDNLSNVYPAPATVTIKPASYTVATNTGRAVCTPAASYTNAAPYNLLAGTDDLTSGQSCVIKFIAVVDYGTSAVDTTVRLNTTYASGMPANGTPNPGYTLPVGGTPVPPVGSSTTDTSVTSHTAPTTTGTTTPPGGAPNTGPTTPTLPATPGADPVIGTPTPVVFVVPKIDVVKAAGVPTQVSAKVFEVPYTIVVGNVGATSPTVFNVQAQDNLSNVYPAPATVTIKPASYTVATNTGGAVCTPAASYTNAAPYNLLAGTDDLTSGQSCVIKFIAVVDYGTSAVDTTVRLNTTYASGMPANGTPNPGYTLPVGGTPVPPVGSSTTDTSVTSHTAPTTTGTTTPPGGAPNTGPTTPTLPATPGADPVIGTPTPVVLIVQKIDVVKAVGVPTQTGPSSFAVPYTVVVKNTGTIPATNVQVDDNLAATFATGAPVLSITTPAATAAPCTINPTAFNGVANTRLLAGTDTLAAGASCTITFTVNVAYPSVAAIPAAAQDNTAIANTYTAPPSTIGGPPTGAPIASDISTTGNPPPVGSPPGTPPVPPTPIIGDIPTPTPVVFVAPGVKLVVTKTGSKATAEVGDTLVYTVTVKRTDTVAFVPSLPVHLMDTLPAGFTYVPGTLTANGASQPDSVLMLQGQVMNIALPSPTYVLSNTGNTVTVTYRVRVGVGSMEGTGTNRVQAKTGAGINCSAQPMSCSNEARYTVKVNAGVFTPQACVIGKVYVDCNQNGIQDNEEIGIPGVRLYLLDGTNVITDVEGKYNVCDLKPQTHVIAVDRKTMPRGSIFGTTSNRNALDGSSLFMDLKKGELHRADFSEASCANPIIEQVKARRAQGEVRAKETENGRSPAAQDNKGLKYQGKPIGNPVETTDGANQPAIRVRQ